MATIVGAVSMSHAPGATGWPEKAEPAQRRRIDSMHAQIARYLDDCKPDVIIALLDDHFENLFRNLMPTFAIGIAPSHSGPAEHIMKAIGYDRREVIASRPALAEDLLKRLVHAGFDVARMGEVEYGNNLMTPLKVIRPQFDIPVIPFYTNVFTPPLPPTWRALQLGAALRTALEANPEPLRIALLATGGLSHWPPVWTPDSPESDTFLQRMRVLQTEGHPVLARDPGIWEDLAAYEIEMAARNQWPLNSDHPLVNDRFDREVIAAIGRGDAAYFESLSYDEVQRQGGHGGHELLNWLIVMGAMKSRPAKVLGYEPVIEWICGMGYVVYEDLQ